jgi:hypothetical protein
LIGVKLGGRSRVIMRRSLRVGKRLFVLIIVLCMTHKEAALEACL